MSKLLIENHILIGLSDYSIEIWEQRIDWDYTILQIKLHLESKKKREYWLISNTINSNSIRKLLKSKFKESCFNEKKCELFLSTILQKKYTLKFWVRKYERFKKKKRIVNFNLGMIWNIKENKLKLNMKKFYRLKFH